MSKFICLKYILDKLSYIALLFLRSSLYPQIPCAPGTCKRFLYCLFSLPPHVWKKFHELNFSMKMSYFEGLIASWFHCLIWFIWLRLVLKLGGDSWIKCNTAWFQMLQNSTKRSMRKQVTLGQKLYFLKRRKGMHTQMHAHKKPWLDHMSLRRAIQHAY